MIMSTSRPPSVFPVIYRLPLLWKGYFSKEGMLSGGAGDLFFGVLNASCCALGFRMFYNRDILSKNLVGFRFFG